MLVLSHTNIDEIKHSKQLISNPKAINRSPTAVDTLSTTKAQSIRLEKATLEAVRCPHAIQTTISQWHSHRIVKRSTQFHSLGTPTNLTESTSPKPLSKA